MKKHLLFIVIFILLFTSACQSNQLANNNPVSGQTEENQQANETSEPDPTGTPVPEPTEIPIPLPTPTPTLDPMGTRFSVNALPLANLTDGGPIISMAFHPDSILFANSGIETIVIWETRSLGYAFQLNGHEDVIIDLGWSPDGSTLASLSADETIRLWAAPEYEEAAVFNVGLSVCFDWSPNGEAIAVGMASGEIQIWDVTSGQIQDTLPGNEANPIIQVMWSPDGTMLAAGGLSGEVSIWSVENQKVVTTLTDPENSLVNDLAWSPDGQYIATAHENGFVHLWNPNNWEIVQSIEAIIDSSVTKIAWSPDSLMLATGGDSSSVSVWEAASGKLITGVGVQTIVWSLVWSPNGKFLVVGSAGKYTGKPRAGSFDWGPGGEHEGIFNVAVDNPDAGYIYFYIRK